MVKDCKANWFYKCLYLNNYIHDMCTVYKNSILESIMFVVNTNIS